MLQTAERTLHTVVGPNVEARFLGNAPWGYYKYKYPKSLRRESGAIGGKVWLYEDRIPVIAAPQRLLSLFS